MIKKFTIYLSLIFFGFFLFKSQSFLLLCFGLCLFIYAMTTLEQSFKLMGGSSFPKFIKYCTRSRFKSFLFGLISTAVMQSSGLVSVLAISFLSAGMITLAAGIAIILGANLGTTTRAWIIAGIGLKMNIAKYAMPMVIFGVILSLNSKNNVKGVGYLLFSLGFLFLGIDYMKSAFAADTIDFSKYALVGFKGVIIYSFIGIIATILMQSSHATLTLTLTALATNQIGYENAVAIAIGSNVGSTIMAVIGSIKSNYKGKQLMMAHVICNVTVAVISVIFFNILVEFSDQVSNFFGIDKYDYTLKLAVFHTIFNALIVIIFYPIINRFANFLDKLFQRKNKKDAASIFLSQSAMEYPESAKEVLIKEIKRLFKISTKMISKTINIDLKFIRDKSYSQEEIIKNSNEVINLNFDEEYEKNFKPLYSDIINFTIKAGAKSGEEHMAVFMDIRRVCLLLAEILKDAKNINSNFEVAINSDNSYIKKEYDNLRFNVLSSLIKADNIIKDIESKACMDFLIDQEKYFDNISITYGSKYQQGEIDPIHLTSLMNDAAICGNLIKKLQELSIIVHNYNIKNRFGL